MKRIDMAAPYFSDADRRRIHRDLDGILDGALSMGPNVEAFEREFAACLHVKYAVAMNSCTSALEAALLSCNAAGREVIVPAETFVATGMAVVLSGGIPVFAEVSPSTLCLDVEDVRGRITPRTAGVILVHMAGLITPDIEELRKLCVEKDIFLIEDAAHGPGAVYAGKCAGTFGDAACFSFFPTKVITAGEGGMLVTDDEGIATYARSLQNRGRDMHAQSERYSLPGRNVRMTETTALIGRVQLEHLNDFVSRRRQLAAVYRRELSDVDVMRLLIPHDLQSSSFWKIPLILDVTVDRTAVIEHMRGAGIAVDAAYQPPLHLQPVFRDLYGTDDGMLPVTEDLLRRNLCLPCHPRLSDDDAVRVASTLRHAIAAAGARE